jgi:hypothetical protein
MIDIEAMSWVGADCLNIFWLEPWPKGYAPPTITTPAPPPPPTETAPPTTVVVPQKASLTISKIVTGTNSISKEFQFIVTFDESVMINWKLTRSFSFTLKHGKQKIIPSLPVGVGYTVTETVYDGYTASIDGSRSNTVSGTIKSTGNSHTVTNHYRRQGGGGGGGKTTTTLTSKKPEESSSGNSGVSDEAEPTPSNTNNTVDNGYGNDLANSNPNDYQSSEEDNRRTQEAAAKKAAEEKVANEQQYEQKTGDNTTTTEDDPTKSSNSGKDATARTTTNNNNNTTTGGLGEDTSGNRW